MSRTAALPVPLRRAAARAKRGTSAFLASARAAAAVEFALILPLMLLILLGMTEITFGINMKRKVTLMARTLADLTGRMTTINDAEMNNIFSASSSVMAPFTAAGGTLAISSIIVKEPTPGSFTGTVCWNDYRNADAPTTPLTSSRARLSTYTVPDGFKTTDTTFILVETKVPYTPMFGAELLPILKMFGIDEGADKDGKSNSWAAKQIIMTEIAPWPVRNVKEVIRDRAGVPDACPP
jgi:Flp pilus assembly protein TadG